MIRGPQLRAGTVALLATERQLDLAVAHQAVRHLGHVCAADGIRGINAAVAGKTRIRPVQLRANIAGGRQVLARVESSRNDGRCVAELQMLLVAEMHEKRLRRRRNRDALMTLPAHRRRRQIVVLNASAMCDRGMTARAVGLQFQVDAVGKRRRTPGRGERKSQNRDSPYELQLRL
jgi:hypothetical protein